MAYLHGIAKAEAIYGVKYSTERLAAIQEQLERLSISEKHFEACMNHLLENNKFPMWTLADLLAYKQEIHNYAWYLQELNKNGAGCNASIWHYLINGDLHGYSYESDLPFPKRSMRKSKGMEGFK